MKATIRIALTVVAIAALFAGFRQLNAAAGTNTYSHPKDAYSLSHPSTWSVKKGGKSVTLKPPSAVLKTLKAQGVTYTASVAVLNNDPALYTSAMKAALKQGWKPFVKTAKTVLAEKYGATAATATYKKSGWTAGIITLTAKKSGVATTWQFVVMTKDKKKVFMVAEKWTKKSKSPFANEVKALVKSLGIVTTTKTVMWSFDGSNWKADSTPPACASPLVIPSPVNTSLATSILYPGQSRGGNYKPHGGFRFDNSSYNDIVVTVPLDAHVVSASRYTESGVVQYLFDLYIPCGIRIRFDHLHTLSGAFQAIADALPSPKVDDSRTTNLATPVVVKAGDVVGTAVGTPGNPFVDFGVYDLRQRNTISSDADWANEHASEKAMGWYAVCWLDLLSQADADRVRGLPGADGTAGKTSDYCTTTSPGYETYAPYAGTWSGSWSNTTFGSTGAMTGTLTVNDDGTAQLVLDVDGAVFGLVNPSAKTFSGTYNEDALTFTGTGDDLFGNLTMTFASTGSVTASGIDVPATDIDMLSLSGTVTATALNANYTLTLGSLTYAQGTMSLTKN